MGEIGQLVLISWTLNRLNGGIMSARTELSSESQTLKLLRHSRLV
jgi:hypothetical protein